MEVIDRLSTIILAFAILFVVWHIGKLIYNMITDKQITVTNRKTGKSAKVSRKINLAEVKKLREVLS